MQGMPLAAVNDIDIWHETFGDPDDPPLLLVMGLGGQATAWDIALVQGFVDRGFYVIRYDNRDVGLSTKIDTPDLDLAGTVMRALAGDVVDVPYTLTDMAADAVALLDHLGIESAHLVGISMGGMIVQTVAIEHPGRVRTLTSIMSTTGNRAYGHPKPEAAAMLMRPPARARDEAIEASIEGAKVTGTQSEIDEVRIRARAEVAYDRCFCPEGAARQFVGILASGDREAGLGALDLPTLVIHGSDDPLVGVDGGERTAEVVPGAQLLVIEGMGHDLPPVHWPQIIEAITTLAGKVEANG
jgi:pimeloyl-ACP methyl ester carboxylesterase